MEKSPNAGLWWWVYNSVNLLKNNWVAHLVDTCYVNYILVKLEKKSVTRFKSTPLRSFRIVEEIFHFFFIFHDGITEEFITSAKGGGGSGSNASDGEWRVKLHSCAPCRGAWFLTGCRLLLVSSLEFGDLELCTPIHTTDSKRRCHPIPCACFHPGRPSSSHHMTRTSLWRVKSFTENPPKPPSATQELAFPRATPSLRGLLAAPPAPNGAPSLQRCSLYLKCYSPRLPRPHPSTHPLTSLSQTHVLGQVHSDHPQIIMGRYTRPWPTQAVFF